MRWGQKFAYLAVDGCSKAGQSFRDWHWRACVFYDTIYALSENTVLNHGGAKYGANVLVNSAGTNRETYKKAAFGTGVYDSGNPGSFRVRKPTGHLQMAVRQIVTQHRQFRYFKQIIAYHD